jgi:hypothetical protein
MLAMRQNKKFCWICGKDLTLEHSITDEHGLSLHHICYEKRMLLKAASRQIEQWREGQSKKQVA